MMTWGITDIGKLRTQNQDSYQIEVLHESGQAVCLVCDGMGGAKAGNIASRLAADTFMEDIRMQLKPGMSLKACRAALAQAVSSANARVYEKAQSDSIYYGMGTTLVGGIITAKLAVICNVGDSRAYIIDADGIEQITVDHSVVEDLKSRGELSKEEARLHPSKNLITRALGTDETVLPDIFSVDMRPGDYLLFCSDGLTNMVDEQEILFEVLHGGDPSSCCERLVSIANERGGHDNISIVLVAQS